MRERLGEGYFRTESFFYQMDMTIAYRVASKRGATLSFTLMAIIERGTEKGGHYSRGYCWEYPRRVGMDTVYFLPRTIFYASITRRAFSPQFRGRKPRMDFCFEKSNPLWRDESDKHCGINVMI